MLYWNEGEMAALYPSSYVLLDIHKDEVKVISCVATAAGWCCLPGRRWLILSIPVKVVTKGSHLQSHKWVSTVALREMWDPVIFVQMWLGACEEGYLSCTGSTRSVRSLWISLLLSSAVFHLSVQKSDNTRCLSGVPRIHSWTNPLMKTRKAESGGAWREPCVLVQQDAGCFWYLELKNHPLNVLFIQV